MLFTELSLDDRLQRALATAGFITPSPIQAAALPVALDGRDLVGTAQTGTGKTAAFVLPILQRLIATPLETRGTRALILAPTRELVEQILAVVRELGIHTNVRAVAVYGGVAMQQQTRALRNGVEIVVACPGRLLDHIRRRNTDFRQLDCLVLDEADRMLDMGFLPPIQDILGHLPAERQTMLFSATFPKTLNAFVQDTLSDPERVEVDTAVPAQTVRHSMYHVRGLHTKTSLLTALLRQLIPQSDSVLIFTRTRVMANKVAEHLDAAGMQADVLHAEKTQRARQDTLDQFRSGVFPYLVATDIAARGIDVTSISHVINFDMPAKPDDYLHRIGRTGRMERAGHAISLVTSADTRAVRDIERMLGKRIEIARLEGGDQPSQGDALPMPHDDLARPPRHHVTAHAPTHPVKPHYPGKAERRRHKTRTVDAPQRPQGPRTPAVSPSNPSRPSLNSRDDQAPFSSKPEKRAGDNRYPDQAPFSSKNRERAGGDTQYSDQTPSKPKYRERTGDTRYSDQAPPAPKRRERAGDTRYSDQPTSGAPRREYPGKRRAESAPPRADRPQPSRYGDAPQTRQERRRQQFGDATSAPQRPDQADRRYRDEGTPRPSKKREFTGDNRFSDRAPSAPKRRERTGDTNYSDQPTSAAPRRERPAQGGKKFNGMASASKFHRKSRAGKRPSGEIPSGPRPHPKSDRRK